jgi:hypothetical protein
MHMPIHSNKKEKQKHAVAHISNKMTNLIFLFRQKENKKRLPYSYENSVSGSLTGFGVNPDRIWGSPDRIWGKS